MQPFDSHSKAPSVGRPRQSFVNQAGKVVDFVAYPWQEIHDFFQQGPILRRRTTRRRLRKETIPPIPAPASQTNSIHAAAKLDDERAASLPSPTHPPVAVGNRVIFKRGRLSPSLRVSIPVIRSVIEARAADRLQTAQPCLQTI